MVADAHGCTRLAQAIYGEFLGTAAALFQSRVTIASYRCARPDPTCLEMAGSSDVWGEGEGEQERSKRIKKKQYDVTG